MSPLRSIVLIAVVAAVLVLPAVVHADDAATWYSQGEEYARKGDYPAAIDAYTTALSINPSYTNAHVGLGFVYTTTGQKEKAIDAYRQALALEPNLTIAWKSLAYVYGTMGRNEEALAALDTATAISPEDPYAWLSKGITLSTMGRFNESTAAYRTVIALSPNDADAWMALGLDYFVLGNMTDALDCFTKTLAIDERNGNAWNYKGQCLHRLGRYQEAIEAYNRGLIVDPKNADLIQNKALSERALRSYVGESDGIPTLYLLLGIAGIAVAGGAGFAWKRRSLRRSGDVAGGPESPRPAPATDGVSFAEGAAVPSIPHDVFISYSSRDKPIADGVCASLEADGIRCWLAPRDVLPGTNFPRSIIEAIETSRVMVLVFSSHSNRSTHVVRELTHAVAKGVIIVPFRIEDIPLSKDMEYLIGVPHWLDAMNPPLEKHIAVLKETVATLLRTTREPS